MQTRRRLPTKGLLVRLGILAVIFVASMVVYTINNRATNPNHDVQVITGVVAAGALIRAALFLYAFGRIAYRTRNSGRGPAAPRRP